MDRRRLYLVVLAAFVVAVASLIVVIGGDDGDDTGSAPTTTTTTIDNPTSTTGSSTTVVEETSESIVLWPFPGTSPSFAAPVDAARSFAKEFLRFEAPVVGEFAQGDTRSGEVPIRPSAKGPVTTVLVRQVGAGDEWSVIGAVNDSVDVDEPVAGATISSPVRVAGKAVAFEGTVNVEVREDGELSPIGEGVVTGGGDVKRPFEGRISFDPPGTRYGALVFLSLSAENGQVWQAAAFRVAFRSTDVDATACGSYHSPRPQLEDGQMEVKAYFHCDAGGEEALHPVYRAVPSSPARLRASLDALLAGPTADEKAATLSSWFSDATAGMVDSIVLRDGHAVVDFDDLRPVIPNASASAGSQRLLAELDATVFQFATVSSAEYRIDGSCETFTEWLQLGGCEPRTRPSSGGST